CTRTARIFDFPEEAPIIRFLDTRGLGEAGYDAAADIAFCEGRAHLVLAVVKALDAEQNTVLDVLRQVRQRHPDWRVVVAQTTLHEAYRSGSGHILPYPFTADADRGAISEELARSLAHQRKLFSTLPGKGGLSFVPIDFTQPNDGYEPADYGR